MKKIYQILSVFLILIFFLFFCYQYYQQKKTDQFWNSLYHPNKMTLFSLDPDRIKTNIEQNENYFHNYFVLGSIKIFDTNDQKKIADEIKNSIITPSHPPKCFIPRHGIRVIDDYGTIDLLICFECGWVYIFFNNNSFKRLNIRDDNNLLNEFLKIANVPLPKEPEK